MNYFRILASGLFACIWALIIAIIVLIAVYAFSPIVILCVAIFIIIIDFLFASWIMMSKRPTDVKLCWVFFVSLFPLIGDLAFIIFGTQPYTQKDIREAIDNWKKYVRYEDFEKFQNLNIPNAAFPIIRYNLVTNLCPISEDNNIKVIADNLDLYKNSIKLIRGAKKFIHIQTYIINDGIWIRTIATELIKKVKEGVKVRILYDWVGSYLRVPKRLIRHLKNAGVNVAIFNPKGINMFKGATNYRSHQKALIVDNSIALYGGSNLGDEYLNLMKARTSLKDMNYIVEGEIVNSLNIVFCRNWFEISDYAYPFLKSKKKINLEFSKESKFLLTPVSINTKNKMLMQLVKTSPDVEEKSIETTINDLIYNAKKSIEIVTAYFYPSDQILQALRMASLKGVKVRIITPHYAQDKGFMLVTCRNLYGSLLKSGVKISEYSSFIHSKYMIIDDEIVFSGSNNLDYRSLWINYENALLIWNKTFAMTMKKIFESDWNHSIVFKLEDLKKYKNATNKFTNFFFYLVHPLI